MSGSSAERDPVERLAEEFAARFRRGEHPSISEYTARYPQWADEIRDLFPALVLVEQFKPAPGEHGGPHPPAPAGTLPPRLGEYRILRKLGEGGMGVVYEAEQESLSRHVALKVLALPLVSKDTARERFKREAQAAARLHHTNIVPVFGVGEADGTYFYAMQYIPGYSLDRVLDDVRQLRQQGLDGGHGHGCAAVARSLLSGEGTSQDAPGPDPAADAGGPPADAGAAPPAAGPASGSSSALGASASGNAYHRGVARIGLQAAEALAYAHRQGVLHRDIKPSNLLLDPQGTVWMTDFGLAKFTDGSDLTRTDELLGTLRYMAPERFRKRCDARSDVYALGLTLYELVALRPAFADTDRVGLIERVLHDEPAPLRHLDPQVPRDLETVILKCMAKDPDERYASAEALAADLRHFLAGEPIRARRTGAWERGLKWARRHPAGAALVGVSALAALTLVGLVVGLWYNRQLQDALRDAREQRAEADRQRAEADRQRQRFEALQQRKLIEEVETTGRYLNDMRMADQAWHNAQVGRVVYFLNLWPGKPGDTFDPRGWEWYYLRGLCDSDFHTLKLGHPNAPSSVAFHPDGRRIAVADWVNAVYVWDVIDGRKIHELWAHEGRVDEVAFSPDGTRMASAGWGDRAVRLWDVDRGRVLEKLPAKSGVRSVAFSPDGGCLVWSEENGTVTFWDLATGTARRQFAAHSRAVMCVKFSPDGRRLATAGEDALAKLWEVADGKPLHTLAGHQRQISSVAFSPDGRTLATASQDQTIKLWDTDTGKLRATLQGHRAWAFRVAFSPDGRWLASAGDDMTVRFWDAARGKEVASLRGHPGEYLRGLAFSPDGRFLATSAVVREVKVWDLTRDLQAARRLFPAHDDRVGSVAFTADSRRLASASRDGTVRLWDVAGGRLLRVLDGDGEEVRSVAYGAGDKLLAAGVYDGTVKLWDPGTGQLRRTLTGHNGPIQGVAFSPDGRWVAAAGGNPTVSVWDAASGRKVQTLTGHTSATAGVAFSPDGRRLASTGDWTFRLWDTQTWQAVRTTGGFQEFVTTVAFSPDGRRLASAGVKGGDGVKLWDAASGDLIRTLKGLGGNVRSVAFTPDSRRLAAAGSDGTIKLWDTATGQEALTLKGRTGAIYSLAFSPDGRWLAGADGEVGACSWVVLWEAPRDGTPAGGERAAPLNPDHLFRWHLNEAEDALRAGQRAAALWHVDRLGQSSETEPLLYDRLADVRVRLGQWAEAVAAADVVLREQPDDPTAHRLRGQACQQLGRHAEAVADFTAALTHSPHAATLHELRAASYQALGQVDLARADRAQAVKLGTAEAGAVRKSPDP